MSISSTSTPVQKYIDDQDYAKAFDQIEATLLQSESVSEAFFHEIEALLPHLSVEKKEELLEKSLKQLAWCSALSEQQHRFLNLYGDLFLEKEKTVVHLITATRSYATAFALGAENHERLSRPFFFLALDGFRYQLMRAAGKGDREAFIHLLEAIPHWHQKFSKEAHDSREFFRVARSVYRELNENPKKNVADLLPQIETGEKGEIPLDETYFVTQRYRERLLEMRSRFSEEGEIAQIQKCRGETFQNFIRSLLEEAFFILGPPPCHFDIRAMGSAARLEVCPYSDFEYMIFIQDPTYQPYFIKLAQIVDLQILSLGETDPKHQGLFDFGQKAGFEIDHQSNPAYHFSLIDVPSQLFKAPDDDSEDALKAYRARFCSVSVVSNHTFTIPSPSPDLGLKLIEMQRRTFQNLGILCESTCNVKHEFMEPLIHFLHDLGMIYGIDIRNTLSLIEELPFTDQSKRLLAKGVEEIYRIRVRLHLASRGLQEEASLVPAIETPVLKEGENKALQEIYHLVLLPVYRMDLESGDLVSTIFAYPTEEGIQLAGELLSSLPFDDVKLYYRMLNSPEQTQLRAIFLSHVPEYAPYLAEIPNRAGFRHARIREQEELKDKLHLLTTTDPASGVKITSPLLDTPVYLTEESSLHLFDKNKNLRKNYPDSLHNVCAYRDLHFKQLPFQPLMEFAIHSLVHRIMGKATPTTTLVRLEFCEHNIVYPVLVSETIEGDPIDCEQQLLNRHFTWLRLCEVLIKPGDGRPANYIVQLGKVYCIDNDISFVEPIVKNLVGHKVTFCSSLFTLDQPLDPDVCKKFCELEPDLILTDWLKEMQEQEELYCALFPDVAELQQLYQQDLDRRFIPFLLLPKGTVSNLCLQFYHLQAFLRNNSVTDPLLLLREILALQDTEDNRLGPLVERAYRKAISLPFNKRLETATNSRSDQSMTSQQAMKLNFKRIPTFAQVQERSTYSLREGFHELCLLEAQKIGYNPSADDYALQVDFSEIEDPKREKFLISTLVTLYASHKQKPSTLSLKNTKALTPNHLSKLLHPELRVLDLSYSTSVFPPLNLNPRMGTLTLIERLSPNLEELNLEGCTGLTSPTINLSHLKRLNVSHCPKLVFIKATSPSLQKLEIGHCPKLRTVDVVILSDTEVKCAELPKLYNANLRDQLYEWGERFGWGKNILRNPEKAKYFFRKAASINHTEAKTVIEYVEKLDTHSSLSGKIHIPLYLLALALSQNVTSLTLSSWMNHEELITLAGILKEKPEIRNVTTSLSADPRGLAVLLSSKLCKFSIIHNFGKAVGSDPVEAEPEQLEVIVQAIKNGSKIKLLSVAYNELGPEWARALAMAITPNSPLELLHLFGNPLGDEGIRELEPLFKTSSRLRDLILGKCSLSEVGLTHLAKNLKLNRSVAYLHLGNNRFGDEGAEAFVEVVKNNKNLYFVGLNDCGIGDTGAAFIAEALRENRTLTSLLLGKGIGIGGYKAFANLLEQKENRTLTMLRIIDSANPSDAQKAEKEKIETLLWENRMLKIQAFKAAKEGDEKLFELIEEGVSIYQIKEENFDLILDFPQKGHTFLHVAASHGHVHLVSRLLELATNPSYRHWKNKDMQTALDLAREKNHTDIIDLLSS